MNTTTAQRAKIQAWFLLSLLICVFGCEGTQKAEVEPTTYTIRIVSGDNQAGLPGEALPLPVIIEVVDNRNLPVPDVMITWQPTSGTLSDPEFKTAANGRASATWILGEEVGQHIKVAARGSEVNVHVIFSNVKLQFLNTENITGYPNEALAGPFTVQATTEAGVPIPNLPITLMAVTGGGYIVPPKGVTDQQGKLLINWVLGYEADQKIAAIFADTRLEYKPTVDTTFFVSATINGKAWYNNKRQINQVMAYSFDASPAERRHDYKIEGRRSDGSSFISFSLEQHHVSYPLKPGTYPLGQDNDILKLSGHVYQFYLALNGIESGSTFGSSQSGSLTITNINDNVMEGTFFFDLVATGSTPAYSVKNGKFRVRR